MGRRIQTGQQRCVRRKCNGSASQGVVKDDRAARELIEKRRVGFPAINRKRVRAQSIDRNQDDVANIADFFRVVSMAILKKQTRCDEKCEKKSWFTQE